MTYRPYPDRERARRQLNRHYPTPEPSPLQRQLAEGASRALKKLERVQITITPPPVRDDFASGLRIGLAYGRGPGMPPLRA